MSRVVEEEEVNSGGILSYTSDLIQHIINTKDKDNQQGKYMLNNGLEVMDILDAIPIPERCKTLKDAYFLGSLVRRIVSYIQEGDPQEALKIGHETQIVYDKEEK